MSAVAGVARLLLSRAAARHLAGALEEMARDPQSGARRLELIHFEDAAQLAAPEADMAFVSRDVTGLSTKHQLTDATLAAYEVLRRCRSLKWVHIHSAGADRPVWLELAQRGVSVCNSSGANAEVVAHSVLAGLLALERHLPLLRQAQQARQWRPLLGAHMPRDLRGQHAMIVGWGPVGQAIGKGLHMLGLHLHVVTGQTPAPELAARTCTLDDWTAQLGQCDWLILACPLTGRTRQMVDTRVLHALPRGAGLINVARGEVVKESDLTEALRSGQIGKAFLDVFETEPLPQESPLWAMEQVILSPHSAGHSGGNEQRVAERFLTNLRSWLCDGRLNHVVLNGAAGAMS